MIKVRLIRGNKDGMVNKQHKGEFTKEFETTSELAKYLLGVKHIYIVDFKAIPKNKRQSFINKYSTMRANQSSMA